MNSILKTISDKKQSNKKLFALLIDPDKYSDHSLPLLVKDAEAYGVDFFLIGGSLIASSIDSLITKIKSNSNLPVILYPGSPLQLSDKADGIFLLSLISGRNPEYLIGNHVIAAPFLKKSRLEIIPTGYILIENGKTTSVEYISNTKPIPSDKKDIIVSTAMAGEMLGMKCIYLEAGSGAQKTVPPEIISEVKKNIDSILIVGGGISNKKELDNVYQAGADIVVIGSAVEKNPDVLKEISDILKKHQ